MDEMEKNEVLEPTAETETTPGTPAPTVSFTDDPDVAAFIELKVQEGIQKALAGKPPRSATVDPTEQEYKRFDRMTYRERLNLFNSNPHAYNKLVKGAV